MMEMLVVGLAIVWIVTVLYLALGQREILHLRKLCQEKEDALATLQEENKIVELPSDILSTHGRVIEMHKFGEPTEIIAQRLGIPQSKVEMTLKFEKIKKDAAS